MRIAPFRAAILLLLSIAAAAPSPGRPAPQIRIVASPRSQGDEFVGPFPSWSNARTSYGAAGDGMADDTAALQRALRELGTPGHSPVLFLPGGTYRITSTLVLAFTINLSIVGEDPDKTTIVWDGPAGGTMLALNGVAYSRIVRLTFDGARKADVAVDQSWDNSRPHFDTGNEYSDDAFVDVGFGIHGGFKGHGFAETSIRRSHFVRNTTAGVALGNFNALDAWIWESTFDDCARGVTNTPGAGNFHVYKSVFRRSTVADLSMANTGGFSARGNYSRGSKAFFVGAGTNNPATVVIQGNTVIDPVDSAAMAFGNQGPGLLLDNIVRSLPGAAGPILTWSSFLDADVTSIGNTFTAQDPLKSNGRLTTIDDRVVDRATVAAAEPVTQGPLPNLHRQLFEVPADADQRVIQRVIAAAAAQNGQRPVVHFPHGIYSISRTIAVPPSDVQLLGDGYGTILRWTGSGVGPVVQLAGPSHATLREMQIDGGTRAEGLAVENADQIGSRVYMDQALLWGGKETNLFVDRLDNAVVQLENFQFASSPDGASIKVIGGPGAAADGSTSGRTSLFSGASSGNKLSADVSDGGRLLLRDLWYESNAGAAFARIHGRALFTLDGSRISSPPDRPEPALGVNDLIGRAAFLATDLEDRIVVSGDSSNAMVMALAILAERRSSGYFRDSSASKGQAWLINSRQLSILPGIRSAPTGNSGPVDAAFVRAMLAHARSEAPAPLTALPSGVTDVRLHRVWVANGLNNIRLSASRN